MTATNGAEPGAPAGPGPGAEAAGGAPLGEGDELVVTAAEVAAHAVSGAEAEAEAQELEQDPVELMRARGRSPELAGFLGWLLPGLGHLYGGQVRKGAASLVLLVGMQVAGLLLSRGEAVSLDKETGHPFAFVAQVGGGLPVVLAAARTHGKLPGFAPPEQPKYEDPAYVARLHDHETGLLLLMVAGLLNLLLVHDALSGLPGGLGRRNDEARLRRRLEALRRAQAARAAGLGPGPAVPGVSAPAGVAPAPADEGATRAGEAPAPTGEGA